MRTASAIGILAFIILATSPVAESADFNAGISQTLLSNGLNLFEIQPSLLSAAPARPHALHKLFKGLSCMMSTLDFELSDEDQGRSELNMVAGFPLHDRIDALMGYKRIDCKDGHGSYSNSGPVIGAAFSCPITASGSENGAVFRANASLIPLSDDGNPLRIENRFGYAAGLGVAWTRADLAITVAYQYQNIPMERTSGGGLASFSHDRTEICHGPAITIDFRF